MAAAPRRTTEDVMPEAPNAKLIATAREAAAHVAEHYPRWVGDDEAARVAGILTRLANRLEAAGREPAREDAGGLAPIMHRGRPARIL